VLNKLNQPSQKGRHCLVNPQDPISQMYWGKPSRLERINFKWSPPALRPKGEAERLLSVEVLASPRMNARDQRGWERYGDLIHGRGIDAFETQWP
jgi:hypothetical protein